MKTSIGILVLLKSALLSFSGYSMYCNHQYKTEYELFIPVVQSAITILGFLNFITLAYKTKLKINKSNVYVSVFSFISGYLICNYNIDFYIKYSNLLSFELLKYSKFLSSWGLHPRPLFRQLNTFFWKLPSKNPGYAPALFHL